MQDQNVAPFSVMNRLQPADTASTHRVNHGGSAWSIPSLHPAMNQPQDGAPERPMHVILLQASLHASLASEPEDARLTGGTRSLMRRVLGLNVIAVERKSAASIKVLSPAAHVA